MPTVRSKWGAVHLVAAFFIPIGLFGLIFVDPTEGHTPLGILFVRLFGPTGAFWIFRVTCVGIIMLPIGAYRLHMRSERRFNAYFKRQSMLEPESKEATRRQQ